MNLPKNALIETNEDSKQSRIERVLWLDSSNIYAAVIDVQNPKALPNVIRTAEVYEAILNGRARLLTEDPYMARGSVKELTDKEITFRDAIWLQMKDIVSQEPDIYIREKRGILISSVLESGNMSKNTLYKHLRRYWVGGKTKNALLPRYDQAGGKGKKRIATTKKLGRPRKYGGSGGVIIDAATEKVFRASAMLFLKNKQDTSFTAAYEDMLQRFYSHIECDDDGISRTVLSPEDERPSIHQFRYWFSNEYNAEEALILRKGRRRYELDNRPVLYSSQRDVVGPGSVFQVDATIADVYLVSSLNRNNIIGKPVVYLIADVFSRMITGIYVGLEGPSWLGFSMALQNAFSSKVPYCEQYGIVIEEHEWPCAYIPDTLLGDRGEAISKNSRLLADVLGIRVDNTPPYRADLKGIIERMFKTVDEEYISRLPGHIKSDVRVRGGKDYRLDAKLTISEFTAIMIRLVLDYNHNRVLSHKMLDKDMMADNVKPRPMDLWNWGIENRSGILRTAPEDLIRLALMPHDKATVTERGVRYKNLYYTSFRAQSEHWFTKARSGGRFKVDVAYDPRNMDVIYYTGDMGKECVAFELISGEKFGHCSYDEIMYQQELESEQAMHLKEEQRQKKAAYHVRAAEVLKVALTEADEEKDPSLTNSRKIKGIKENRRNEKTLQRKRETAHAVIEDHIKTPEGNEKSIQQAPKSITGDGEAANIDLFRRIQKERIHGNK